MKDFSESEKKKWFLTCFDQYESSLLRFAFKIVGNKDTAQEIVQDAFVKLWEKFSQQDLGSESPWLFTVTRNAAFDVLRKNKKTHVDIANQVETLAYSADSAESALEKRGKENDLLQKIEKLKPEERQILILKFAEEKSYAEISKITGMSTNHIAVFVFNVMKKLRNQYKEHNYEAAKR